MKKLRCIETVDMSNNFTIGQTYAVLTECNYIDNERIYTIMDNQGRRHTVILNGCIWKFEIVEEEISLEERVQQLEEVVKMLYDTLREYGGVL